MASHIVPLQDHRSMSSSHLDWTRPCSGVDIREGKLKFINECGLGYGGNKGAGVRDTGEWRETKKEKEMGKQG